MSVFWVKGEVRGASEDPIAVPRSSFIYLHELFHSHHLGMFVFPVGPWHVRSYCYLSEYLP